MCGVARLGRTRNEYIRGSLGIVNIAKKIDWDSLDMLKDYGYIIKEMGEIKVKGNRGRSG